MSQQITTKLPVFASACALAVMFATGASSAGMGSPISHPPTNLSSPPPLSGAPHDISVSKAPGGHAFSAPTTGTRIPAYSQAPGKNIDSIQGVGIHRDPPPPGAE